MRLAEKIEKINQSFSRMMSQDDLHSLRKEIKKLAESGLAERSLKIGESIPECILPNERNEKIDVHSMLRNQPVIISFYRGQWCPYCNLELRAFQEALPEIKKLHAQLVAISPQTPDYSLISAMGFRDHLDLSSGSLAQWRNYIGNIECLSHVITAIIHGNFQFLERLSWTKEG
jgi:thiol-disulfide isomerase/thioredoxin